MKTQRKPGSGEDALSVFIAPGLGYQQPDENNTETEHTIMFDADKSDIDKEKLRSDLAIVLEGRSDKFKAIVLELAYTNGWNIYDPAFLICCAMD